MDKSIYNTIINEYENRQNKAYSLLSKKKAEVYTKIPRIEEIDREIQLCGVKYNKMILLESVSYDIAIDELHQKIKNLKKEKELLLEKNSFGSKYLEPKFQCIQCKDTGFLTTFKSTEKCSCFKQQYIDHLFKQSNLKLINEENFETFNDNFYPDVIDESKYGIKVSPRKNIFNIKEKALTFIDNIDNPSQKNLFFSGPTGVGKTFMINCIAAKLLNIGRTVLYQTSPSIFNIISEYRFNFQKGDIHENTIYNNIFNVELLIIDDLGTEPHTATRYAELLNIINIRQENNLVRPCKTILSSNLGINKLTEYYDERVASRIIGGFDLFRFAGEDIRMIKKLQS
ncbi:UNVERIFIED_CONTAM: DNA replication protein DnaC [Acetivibrio alkalicellulosi]